MLRAPSLPDPSADAAALLRRLGFATLFVTLPVAALLSRRGVVLVFPIGAALLIAAALIDREFRSALVRARGLAGSVGCRATMAGLVWAAASLAWVPTPSASAERLAGLAGTLALAAGIYLSLPERTRSANLYLMPIGTAAAALVGLVVWATGHTGFADRIPGDDDFGFERGLYVLVLFVWPSIAWLRSRDRDLEAVCLALVCGIAAVAGANPYTPVALAAGGLSFVLTSMLPGRGAAIVASLLGVVIVLMPALPFLKPLLPLGTIAALTPAGPLDGWRAVIVSDPIRLVTGHGFGALAGNRLAGLRLPDTPLLQLWYELGIVGSAVTAVGIWVGTRSALDAYRPLLPSVMGAFAATITLAASGAGAGQAWEPVAASVLALAFVAAQRGQYRTRRPKADALVRAA